MHLLRFFYGLKVVKDASSTKLDNGLLQGILSSLKSITCDSMADQKKYPNLYQQLFQQSLGSQEIAEYILSIEEQPNCVYVFNGRISSASVLVNRLHYQNFNLRYYEYSGRKGGYHDYPYPCHNSRRLGQDITKLWEKTIISYPELFRRGISYQQQKLNNQFVQSYQTRVVENYDAAVFLGSDHEYTNLQSDIVKMKSLENIGLLNYVIKMFGENSRVVVRAHPNQANDPSAEISLGEIRRLCEKFGYTYYAPNSTISSYDLINNSGLTVADYSSISIDAILLGAKVLVVGDRDLNSIIEKLNMKHKIPHHRQGLCVSEIMTLYDELFFHPFSNKLIEILARAFEKIDRYFNRKFYTKFHDG